MQSASHLAADGGGVYGAKRQQTGRHGQDVLRVSVYGSSMEFFSLNAQRSGSPPTLTHRSSFLLYLYDVEKALRRKLGPVDCDFVLTLYHKNLPVETAVALLRQ